MLDSKRLDLDAAKTKYKKMKSLPAKENVGVFVFVALLACIGLNSSRA